jgi:hypothetical protein
MNNGTNTLKEERISMDELEEFLDWKWDLYDAIWALGEMKELNSALEPLPEELMTHVRSFRKDLESREVNSDFMDVIRKEIINDITEEIETAFMISDEMEALYRRVNGITWVEGLGNIDPETGKPEDERRKGIHDTE